MLDAILEREKEAPMAYPSGIAIPHIRVEGLADTLIGMTFLQNPLNYDGLKAHWIVLIFTDRTSSKIYLNIVSTLLKLSQDTETMQRLMSMRDGHSVIHYLRHEKINIGGDISISDIMVTNPICIGPEEKLSRLDSVINEHRVSMIPVVDERGNYLGEVNILDVLKVGVPDYIMRMDDLTFLKSFEPLEKLFEKEEEISVREIMRDDRNCLKPEASIIEAVTLMIREGRRYLSVVDNGHLVGVVTAMDIFRKVIKA
jgi:CBS domain-containing protein